MQLADGVEGVGPSPGTRFLDALLQYVAAFDLAGAYGQVAFEGEGVVELDGAVFYVVNGGPHWCLSRMGIGGLDTGTHQRQLPATSPTHSCSCRGGRGDEGAACFRIGGRRPRCIRRRGECRWYSDRGRRIAGRLAGRSRWHHRPWRGYPWTFEQSDELWAQLGMVLDADYQVDDGQRGESGRLHLSPSGRKLPELFGSKSGSISSIPCSRQPLPLPPKLGDRKGTTRRLPFQLPRVSQSHSRIDKGRGLCSVQPVSMHRSAHAISITGSISIRGRRPGLGNPA